MRSLLKAAFLIPSLLFVPVAHADFTFCSEDMSRETCLAYSRAVTTADALTEELEKLNNVVENNSHVDQFESDTRQLLREFRLFLRFLRVQEREKDYDRTNDLYSSFRDVEEYWTVIYNDLRPYTNRYADLRLHTRKTERLFNKLSKELVEAVVE